MQSVMPAEPHADDRQMLTAVAEVGWGGFGTEARDRVRRDRWALQAPVPPVLLAVLVAMLDATACIAAGVALLALPIPAGRSLPVLIGFLAILAPCMIAAVGGYRHAALYGSRRAALAALAGLTLGGGGLALAALMVGRPAAFPPDLALLWLGFAILPLLSGRLAAALAMRASADRTRQRAVLVGDRPQAARFLDALRGRQDRSIEVIGLVEDRRTPRPEGARNDLPSLGSVEQLGGMIRRGEVEQIILALPWAAEDRLAGLLRLFADYPVDIRLAPDLQPGRCGAPADQLRLLRISDRPISGWGAVIKTIEDYLLALTGLAVAALPMALIALAVRLDSPGPVLFRQRRTGFNNRDFHVLKFRTLYAGDADPTVVRQVSAGDARITRVGAILRRTSLDELPQIFNVLRGEMSFIGPRPHAPGTRAGGRPFEEVAARYAARHRVKPGLTGLAQVRGWRGPTETEEKLIRRVESDLEYIETWSPWLDVVILVRTLLAVARMRNAC